MGIDHECCELFELEVSQVTKYHAKAKYTESMLVVCVTDDYEGKRVTVAGKCNDIVELHGASDIQVLRELLECIRHRHFETAP
jgi:hypothetical protein